MTNGSSNPTPGQFIIVLIGGAIGGLLSYFFSLVTGNQLLSSTIMTIVVSVCLGAFIALIVVFLVRWVKTRNAALLLIWAMVSGFLWKPAATAVYTYGTQVINNRVAAATKQSANNASSKLAKVDPTLGADTLKPKIDDAVGSAVETVKSLPDVKDKNARDEAAQKVATTASQLSEVAIQNDDPSVTQKATEALKALGQAALDTKSYGVANAVSKSLNDVVNKAPSRKLKEQAWATKEKIDASNVPSAASSTP